MQNFLYTDRFGRYNQISVLRALLAHDTVLTFDIEPIFNEYGKATRREGHANAEAALKSTLAKIFEKLTEVQDYVNKILCQSETRRDEQLDWLAWLFEQAPDHNPVLRAFRLGSATIHAFVREYWIEHIRPQNLGRNDYLPEVAISQLPVTVRLIIGSFPESFDLEIGYSLGVQVSNKRNEPTKEEILAEARTLKLSLHILISETCIHMAILWATIATFVRVNRGSTNNGIALTGLRHTVSKISRQNPDAWAEALPWLILIRHMVGKSIETTTLHLAASSPQVAAALDAACQSPVEEVRLFARGMKSVQSAEDSSGSEFAKQLMDAAAHFMDGAYPFPHPLQLRSATWLASMAVEHILRDGINSACQNFSNDVKCQGGKTEEALTQSLISEIEIAFRNVQPRIRAMPSLLPSPKEPILKVGQRATSKMVEEAVYGCDIAWVLSAKVPGVCVSQWVELVQVKKSLGLQNLKNRRESVNSWVISCGQLKALLEWSQTSAYWLIGSSGDVQVVAAKYLFGMMQGRDAAVNSSFTVRYHEIRSASIPLEQFLIDLLIGHWVGTTASYVLEFAKGKHINIRPKLVLEVSISTENSSEDWRDDG